MAEQSAAHYAACVMATGAQQHRLLSLMSVLDLSELVWGLQIIYFGLTTIATAAVTQVTFTPSICTLSIISGINDMRQQELSGDSL